MLLIQASAGKRRWVCLFCLFGVGGAILVNVCVTAALHFGVYQFYQFYLDCLIVFRFIKS